MCNILPGHNFYGVINVIICFKYGVKEWILVSYGFWKCLLRCKLLEEEKNYLQDERNVKQFTCFGRTYDLFES